MYFAKPVPSAIVSKLFPFTLPGSFLTQKTFPVCSYFHGHAASGCLWTMLPFLFLEL